MMIIDTITRLRRYARHMIAIANAQDAALAEKLRKKAELQKKAARPATFSASLEGEMQKKKEMSAMSKEEKRNRLCEELGRGC